MTGIINIYQNNTWVKSAGGMRICSDLEDERKHLLNQMFPTLKKCGCGTAAGGQAGLQTCVGKSIDTAGLGTRATPPRLVGLEESGFVSSRPSAGY